MSKIQRALISVSDKTGLLDFVTVLHSLKIEILSTGGTAKFLKENKIPVIEVGDYTGQPEILDGRLKTLHPKIHGGILGIRSNPKHLKEMEKSQIGPIDLVVVNLYPFEQTIAKVGAGHVLPLQEAIENIDIGGPTMIRAAAKNWQDVTVIVDPRDYEKVLEEIKKTKGLVSAKTNFNLAKKVFVTMARYEGAIANYLTGEKEGQLPDSFNYQGIKVQDLRYGENPHQKAAYYTESGQVPAKQLHGKELSFNNILDLDAAISLVREFDHAACVIIKHTNPCGVAIAPLLTKEGDGGRSVFIAARQCDPLSAFGGIIGLNRKVDVETAQEIAKDFYECVVAPGFDSEAFKILAAKKNIRLMELADTLPNIPQKVLDLKKVSGGLLVQEKDQSQEKVREAKVVTKRSPSDNEWQALEFAWKVCKHVKSNAIVFVGGKGVGVQNFEPLLATVGIGCGQMSRVDATRIGITKAKSSLKGAVMASDAFFPFRDNIDEAAKAGIQAIIQPGGSLRDQESIDAANDHGIAMIFTGVRHFRH